MSLRSGRTASLDRDHDGTRKFTPEEIPGSPSRPKQWNDEWKTVRRLRKTYFTATRRLQDRGSDRIAESYGDDLRNQIDDGFHRVTREVVAYAESVENSVLVLEDLTYIRESMDYGEYSLSQPGRERSIGSD